MFGILRNYFVAEAEFGEHDYEDDVSIANEHEIDEFPGELRVCMNLN